MTRRIVSIAGPLAEFAVADDGTCWHWNGAAWVPWERAPLPQPEIPVEALLPPPTFSQAARDAEMARRTGEHIASHPPFMAPRTQAEATPGYQSSKKNPR